MRGRGGGADISAWRQAASAELAVTRKTTVGYGVALLDLVKAFERVPHHILVREARRLGYPLLVLRLSLAAYRLPRTLRIGQVFSFLVTACRGITAGSGFATSEMKLIMLHIVEGALTFAPMVQPTLFVDDLAAEIVSPVKVIAKQLAVFVKHVAKKVAESAMELSATKCVCNASTDELGHELEEKLKPLKVTYQRRVKSLGVGLTGGRRRNTNVMNGRLRKCTGRMRRFRKLARMGVDAARLLRTGGKVAMTYGQAVTGVACSTLRNQRRLVASVSAPAAGPCGQNLDVALMIADGGPSGRADPRRRHAARRDALDGHIAS